MNESNFRHDLLHLTIDTNPPGRGSLWAGRRLAAAATCLAVFALPACVEDPQPQPLPAENINDASEPAAPAASSAKPAAAHFVDADEAADLALFVEVSKSIDELTPIPDERGEQLFHVINYREGGFVIVAADDRVMPILAFAEHGRFELEREFFPEGLVGWLYEQKEIIQDVRSRGKDTPVLLDPYQVAELVNGSADDLQAPGGGLGLIPEPGPGSCEDQYTVVGPLLTTSWGQLDAYNDALPYMGCGGDGRPPTGCVATAMAQVMRYYEAPNAYGWDAMPNNSGSDESALLMRDVGEAVNMSYSCNLSGAFGDDMPAALKDDFGYSAANYSDYSHNTVKTELGAGHPVILTGANKSGWWIFVSYSDGHAWVSDGYQSSYFCESGNTYLHLHMNWGWSGDYDGWYGFNNWDPGDYTFNDLRRMVHGIRP